MLLIVEVNHSFVFDVRRDVGERTDLANVRQDVAHRLRPLLLSWERDVDAEARARFPDPGRGAGRGAGGRVTLPPGAASPLD